MHDSTQMLFDEHTLITQAIDAAIHTSFLIGHDDGKYEATVRELIHFFRQYADQFHHYKEEIILFPEMEKKNTMLGDGILHEMFEQHSEFRDMLREIESKLDDGEFEEAQHRLETYCQALLDHIAIENDEVFQIAETLFDDGELEKIYFRFEDCDRELGLERKHQLTAYAESLGETHSHLA